MGKISKKILIIEDEPSMSKLLADKFSKEGFEPLKAADGEAGLKLALKEHPDLILLDIILPKMDGLTMLEKLREDKWGETVPVITLTNLSDNRTIAQALVYGSYEFLVKTDWRIEDVVRIVKEKLGVT